MPVYPVFLLLALLIALPVSAQPVNNNQLDVNIALNGFDAGGNDSLGSNRALNLQYSYYLIDWLAADVGLFVSDKSLDDTRQDIVGYYRASLQTSALLLGIKPRYRFASPYEVYGRLGVQVWQTELEVEEYFNSNLPEGSTSLTDKGTGYYVGIGGAHYITENVLVQLEIRRQVQLDVFGGDSAYPFDLKITSLIIGLGYRF